MRTNRAWFYCAALTALVGCAEVDEERPLPDEAATDTPAGEPQIGVTTKAIQDGPPLIVEAPPVLSDVARELSGQPAHERRPASDMAARLARFSKLSSQTASVVLAEAEGPSQRTSGGWVTSWRTHQVLQGARLPARFSVFQAIDSDERPACGLLEGQAGRRDALLVEDRGDGTYRVLHDDLGQLGQLQGATDRKSFTWQMGERIDASALLGALEASR